MKKRPFLLMELIIALLLLSLCALPLMKLPFSALKKQTLDAEEILLSLDSEVSLASIKELFYQNAIPWKTIESASTSRQILTQEVKKIQGIDYPINQNISIKSATLKPGRGKETWAKVSIEISYSRDHSHKKAKKFLHVISLCQKEVPLEATPS
jgi:hypothetical protein